MTWAPPLSPPVGSSSASAQAVLVGVSSLPVLQVLAEDDLGRLQPGHLRLRLGQLLAQLLGRSASITRRSITHAGTSGT
ncbi:hypothetical protein [Streptomyces sp. NPDC002845]